MSRISASSAKECRSRRWAVRINTTELTPPKSLSSLRQERFNSRGLNCKAMLQIDKLAGACTRDSISICNDVDFINKALER